ncbi:Rz1-like lysis system protein LysC, partial [Piscirickettsia salmonis]|uniref:Rz1-like lysis system protein LysC n=2 Tax=Piscirickettsia salmonis TaxID=1238 RepID=UPI003EBAAA48
NMMMWITPYLNRCMPAKTGLLLISLTPFLLSCAKPNSLITHSHIDASPPYSLLNHCKTTKIQGQTNKAALTWGVENYQSLEQCNTQISHLREFYHL